MVDTLCGSLNTVDIFLCQESVDSIRYFCYTKYSYGHQHTHITLAHLCGICTAHSHTGPKLLSYTGVGRENACGI